MDNERKDITQVSNEKCTGCGACKNVCPVNAISMQYNNEGFLYPTIDRNLCINCGKCFHTCPAEHYEFKQDKDTDCYAVMADDELRMKSSSGGMFGILARYVLLNKGYVCGAKYSDDYTFVEHVIVDNEKDLEKLYKAKYVQSDIKDCFKNIENLLKQEKLVLFCGTACQVAGLNCFLAKQYENLITCDILCHGVGSVFAYQSYLKELTKDKKIVSVDFRPKEKNGWGNYTKVDFDDGSQYYKNWTKDPWYLGFLNGITTRKSCGICKYAQRERTGDFSIGDFWGIDRQKQNCNDKKGTSLVLVNTKKAENLLIKLKTSFKLCEGTDLEMASQNNNVLNRPDGSHKYRDSFFNKLPRLGFNLSFNYIYNKYNIGIIGFWNGNNYGSSFTYFALATTLQKLGYSVCMVEEPYCEPEKVNRDTAPYKFFYKYFNVKAYQNFYGMNHLNTMFDTFILGSDQVFAYPCIKNREAFYLLNFADDDKKKIAYASSFGHSKLLMSDNKQEMFKMSLKRFDAISVREKNGVELCKQLGSDASWVVDPVFICDKNEYSKLADKSNKKIDGEYILAYILDPTPEKREAILHAENVLGKKAKVILTGMDNFEIQKSLMNLDDRLVFVDEIEDFFYYYKNSSFVITDSYHGTCLSIINEKNFISIENQKRGTARTDTLRQMFDIDYKICKSPKDIIENKSAFNAVDYVKLNKQLEIYKTQSTNWLKEAIEKPQDKTQIKNWLK